jgi:serine/threonine-protein kinase
MIGRIFLGRYETRRLLGEGGMGKVYLARQHDLGRDVVVKVMHEHIAADDKFRDRFRRETELMARFEHPGAVRLYDASLTDPLGPCIVMEYVKGVNLEGMLARNGRMSAPRVGRIMGELCEVLQAAHDEAIIHRDLKPANLMIVEPDTPKERVKVMDFGLAKLIETEAPLRKVTDTNVDFAVGTPGYICPEQVRGEEMDHRGDLYSVGIMMYELLTGRLPFIGGTSMDILLAHATEPPPTFAEIGLSGWVPREVEHLVYECLAKDPEDRPQSARELAERFDTALDRAQAKIDSDPQRPAISSERPTPVNISSDSSIHGSVMVSSAPTAVLTAPVREQTALPFHMEAWMPERIAIMKLRGFVHDASGEVIESVPGLIRVRLGSRKTGSGGPLSWIGLRKSSNTMDVELHLQHCDPTQENKLTVHVLFRPSHPSLLADRVWRQKCTQVFVELRAYLMGRSDT